MNVIVESESAGRMVFSGAHREPIIWVQDLTVGARVDIVPGLNKFTGPGFLRDDRGFFLGDD
jgi:hypothetical protein